MMLDNPTFEIDSHYLLGSIDWMQDQGNAASATYNGQDVHHVQANVRTYSIDEMGIISTELDLCHSSETEGNYF